MQLRKLSQSTIFRLTLLYAAFFCICIVGLLSFVYFATMREIEGQVKHQLTNAMNQAQAEFSAHGTEGLKKHINEALEEDDEGLFIYLLVDATNKVLAGNMESWPEDVQYSERWMMFDIDAKNEAKSIHILAEDVSITDGGRLLIGYSLRGQTHMRQVMLDVLSVCIVLALLMTVLGGAFFSRTIKHRLERINLICEQVINGHLEVQVPLTGGGDEFDHLASNVNTMLGRIAELVKGLKQTSDNIAHDLRTPLARHRIRLEGLIDQPPQISKIQGHLKAGIEEVDMIVETLNSILRISQAQSGVASEHFTTFDLSSALVDVLEFYEEFADQKNIALIHNLEPNISVVGDKPLLTQAMANLLDNAIKYTRSGGTIAVSLAHHEQMVEYCVADNGPGIPPEYHAKVKERFFRLEESRTSAGTGLGLSLVDAVAVLHRGELNFADNTPGLIVTLTLPIAAGDAAAPPYM